MHIGVFLIQSVSFIHLVCRCASVDHFFLVPVDDRKKSYTDQYITFSSRHPLNHKLAVIRTLLERCYSIVTEADDRKKEEEHVAKALSKCGYPSWTIDRVKQDIVEKSLKDEAKKAKNTRGNHKGMVVVLRTERAICKNSEISRHRHSQPSSPNAAELGGSSKGQGQG